MSTQTLLNRVTATGAGGGVAKGVENMTFQAYGTTSSGAGAASIDIQVSNDSANWTTAGTLKLTLGTIASTDALAVQASWPFVRGNVTSISGTGATVTLTVGN